VSGKAAISVEQIDELLAAWDERIRRMDDNLVALEGDAIYQILAGKAGKRAVLEGVSRDRVYPALDAVSELFLHRNRLAAMVARAREIRASISALTFWDKDNKLAEIVKLLRGKSIDLGQKVMPLWERNLLDESHRDVLLEPEELLASMVNTFNAARDVILSVSRAWESLEPMITQLSAEIGVLRELSEHKQLAELAEAEHELAALASRVQKDPLGVAESVGGAILPKLKALRAKLDAEIAARSRVTAALERAHALRLQIGEGHARAQALMEQATLEIEGAAGHLKALLDKPLLDGLDQWLHKLDRTAQAHRWQSVEVGLARWHETAEGYRAADEAAAAQAEAALGMRDELSGRFSARRAQAAALLARGGGSGAALEARAREVEALLAQRPFPLDAAKRAVEGYEAAVLGFGGRR